MGYYKKKAIEKGSCKGCHFYKLNGLCDKSMKKIGFPIESMDDCLYETIIWDKNDTELGIICDNRLNKKIKLRWIKQKDLK